MRVFNLILIFAIILLGCRKEDETEYTIEYGTVMDIDSNIYVTVKIGNKWWMAENLRVSRFNDGSPLDYIPVVDGYDTLWSMASNPAYCFINDTLYGYLYHGLVVQSEKQIAPEGWHIPTDEEWKDLEATIGMKQSEIEATGWRGIAEANALASKYNLGWGANNQDVGLYGSDYYGFNAKPSGIRSHDGRTNIQGNTAWWWSASVSDGNLIYRHIESRERRIFRQFIPNGYGLSIRCVKD